MADGLEAPIAGIAAGLWHSFHLRVAFADTDAGGVMHHAAYLVFAERGRTEMLRDHGYSQIGLKQRGLMLAVRTCNAEFLRSAVLDDLLEVRTTMLHLGASSLDIAQSLWREEEELARLRLRLVCIGERGRPCRIPADLRERLGAGLAREGE